MHKIVLKVVHKYVYRRQRFGSMQHTRQMIGIHSHTCFHAGS